ncbi:MAG: serine/threonine protein phosphatase [Phycisphaera sp.]|nr:serine/threonine protein phosphatase [Phycisphaera sp.]
MSEQTTQRILAIGDIHGRLNSLVALIAYVKPTAADLVITLGDYIDRGPDSPGVIDRLIELHRTNRVISLRGNHEQMLIDARHGQMDSDRWQRLGGEATVAAYGGMHKVPMRHWDFLERTCRNFYETRKYIFVHGHVESDLPMNEQPMYALHWRYLRDAAPHRSGRTVICGHTKQRSGHPANIGHTICIDTANWLTCFDVDAKRIYQANEDMVHRTFMLPKAVKLD